MTNMSVRSGPAGNGALDLDIINEYLMEKSLPGPPPPPVEQNIQPVSSCPPSKSRRSGPVLVSRGAAPQAAYSFDQTPATHCNNLTSMHPVRMNKASQKSGPRSAQPQYPQTGTEHLERFLEKPELVVVEQPKERGMRFRYECEGRSAGSILGASSTEVSKTLPAIEIQGPIDHIKKVTVIVSLVTKDIPYRPHPHCLVGKDCVDGICTVHINPQTSARHSFANLGIQCVRRKELDSSLQKRRNKKIDPFNTGHSKSIEDMDMNVVRLCFQCELEGKDGERVSLAPVVSNPIYDKKATTTAELKINRLNVIRGPCTGKTEIYMLCDKVQKDDIEIIFSLEDWEAKAEFAQTDVHRQIAIVFKSPPFREQKIVEEVEVSVCLRRISDRMDSEPVKFIYVPDNADPYGVKRKKRIKSAVAFSESCSASQSPDLVMNEPSTSQPFNSYVPEHSMPGVPTAVPDMATQRMDDIHYTDPYRHEDGCESLAPDTLEKIMSRIAQTLGPQSSEQLFREFYVDFEDTDMKSDLENIQPMMSMAGFNDAHFNQMVSENQGFGELESIDGLVASYSVKSENNLDL